MPVETSSLESVHSGYETAVLAAPHTHLDTGTERPVRPASTASLSESASQPPTLGQMMYTLATHNFYFNLLFVFVPLGILSGSLKWGDSATFVINFVAIIPLAKMLDLATDQLSCKVGQALGALCNASFGNAIELIVGIMALRSGLVEVVQASLIGSILSNLLFVLGFCMLLGGLYHKTQTFNARAANVGNTLLIVTILGYLIPAAFSAQIGSHKHEADSAHSGGGNETADRRVLAVSHGTALLLMIAYISFLVFQLVTHQDLFTDKPAAVASGRLSQAAGYMAPGHRNSTGIPPARASSNMHDASDPRGSETGSHNSPHGQDDDEEEEELLTVQVAIVVLIVTTVIVAICAEYLVDSIEGISVTWGISETFIGLIILPIVGNAAEHVTAVFSAMRNKMDLAIGVAVGSSMQIALFVSPLLVIVGWISGQPLTLDFKVFDTSVLFVSVIVVSHLTNDGTSNWLEGLMLLLSYLIVATAYAYI